MGVDPFELRKSRVKQQQQFQQIEKYREEQEALDKENAVGNIGHHQVKHGKPMSPKMEHVADRAWASLKNDMEKNL